MVSEAVNVSCTKEDVRAVKVGEKREQKEDVEGIGEINRYCPPSALESKVFTVPIAIMLSKLFKPIVP